MLHQHAQQRRRTSQGHADARVQCPAFWHCPHTVRPVAVGTEGKRKVSPPVPSSFIDRSFLFLFGLRWWGSALSSNPNLILLPAFRRASSDESRARRFICVTARTGSTSEPQRRRARIYPIAPSPRQPPPRAHGDFHLDPARLCSAARSTNAAKPPRRWQDVDHHGHAHTSTTARASTASSRTYSPRALQQRTASCPRMKLMPT